MPVAKQQERLLGQAIESIEYKQQIPSEAARDRANARRPRVRATNNPAGMERFMIEQAESPATKPTNALRSCLNGVCAISERLFATGKKPGSSSLPWIFLGEVFEPGKSRNSPLGQALADAHLPSSLEGSRELSVSSLGL